MDWRQPWLWPRHYQWASFVGAACLGVWLISPWWMHSWSAWVLATETQAKLLTQQEATRAMQDQAAQSRASAKPSRMSWADLSVLSQLAQQAGLQLAQMGLDKPQQTPGLSALQMQQLPMHLSIQGSWDGWLNWLTQWPSAAPGVTVASLELKANPRGGISAQVLAVAPQSTVVEASFELSGMNLDGATNTDPFNAQAWASAQRQHAAQHPSYARLVAPELLRPREVLETFARDRLRYVGHIGSGATLEALVKVLPFAADEKDAAPSGVHRVRVGSRLGQDFGQVVSVQPDQLVVQELALTPTGEWQTREVRLPLHETAP